MDRFVFKFYFSFLLLLLFQIEGYGQSNFEKLHGFEPHFILPAEAGIKNLKKDYGAKGDGRTDDTQAFMRWLASKERTLYIPEGTYLVREQIRLADGMKKVTIFGERRSKTIIKLADGSAGFQDPSNPKAFLHLRAEDQHGEQNFSTYVYHLTIEIGKNNSGAIALNYHTNNTGQLKDVTVRATDPLQHKGYRGIAFDDYWFGPGGGRYVEVEGFAEGIFLGSAHNQVTLEHIEIRNCGIALINKGNTCSIRNLTAIKCTSGVRSLGDGLMVLKDANLFQGKGKAAIYNEGALLVSYLQTGGYQKAIISTSGGDMEGDSVHYYTSKPVSHNWTLSAGREKPLDLPVEESPELQYPKSSSEWAVMPSSGDITTPLQQAIDGGVSTVYLTGGIITRTIYLRNNLQRIMAIGGDNRIQYKTGNQPVFKLEEGSTPAVVLELIYGTYGGNTTVPNCVQASARTLVLRHAGLSYKTGKGGAGGKVFMESVVGYPFKFVNVRAWLRDINTERGGHNVPNILNNGSKLWILGMKVEDFSTKIKTTNKGFTELLGGVFRQNWDAEDGVHDLIEENPLFVVENSCASLNFHTFTSPNAPAYKYLVREIRGKEIRNLIHTSHGGCCGGNLTLFVGCAPENRK